MAARCHVQWPGGARLDLGTPGANQRRGRAVARGQTPRRAARLAVVSTFVSTHRVSALSRASTLGIIRVSGVRVPPPASPATPGFSALERHPAERPRKRRYVKLLPQPRDVNAADRLNDYLRRSRIS